MSRAKANNTISNRTFKSALLERERIIVCFALAVAVIFAAAVYFISMIGKNEKNLTAPEELTSRIVTPLNVEAASTSGTGSDSSVQVANYEAVMNTAWLFPDKENMISTNAYVENSRYNKCPVRFKVSLAGSPDDYIYISRDLPVGERQYGVTLQDSLPDGAYEAVVTYYMLDGRGNETGSVKTKVTLYVGEAADDKS